MAERHTLPGVVMALSMLLATVRPVAAVEPPEAGLQRLMAAVETVLAVPIDTPSGQRAVSQLVGRELIPLLDLDGIARRVTGPVWSALAPSMQRRLRHTVESRLEGLAVSALQQHREPVRRWLSGASVLPARRYASGRTLVRLRHPTAVPDEVRLWLTMTPAGWRVSNVTASGFSLAGLSQSVLTPGLGGLLP